MSNEIQKQKRSRRLHQTESIVKNRVKFAKRIGTWMKDIDKEQHRYAKLHPLDCGNSKCVMCGNPRKFWKEETIQEQRNKQDIIQEE